MDKNIPYIETLIDILGCNMDYSSADKSFSPHYSDVGLGFIDETAGIDTLFVHYNRMTGEVGKPFMEIPGRIEHSKKGILGVTNILDQGTVRFAFYNRNSWLVECEGVQCVKFSALTGDVIPDVWSMKGEGNALIFRGSLPNTDERDPDTVCPFIMGLRVINGETEGDGIETPLLVKPDSVGKILTAFSFNVLDVDCENIINLLLAAPFSTNIAEELTKKWIENAMGSLHLKANSVYEEKVLARAVYTLLFNCCEAPGFLAGRVSAFPNRGTYPTHFLWDSCFQNLALEYMNPKLAEDSILLLTENLRIDGKIPHFICSTWMRPYDSQPPLVGWAALRLIKQRNNMGFAKRVLDKLLKNNEWWLTQRITCFGLISCSSGMETGWDNTPRLDKGPVLALDMNSYLLIQMRAACEIAKLVGKNNLAEQINTQADNYAERMLEVFYDPEDNIFKDVLLTTGEKLSIITPASFLPLLADVPLEIKKIHEMLETYLLNPDYFYGEIPFASVAYNEPEYREDEYWRGPTWMPVAYLMLDILKKYNYGNQYYHSMQKLYSVVLKDGNLRELYNSRTGEGMGSYEQGWTAAIFIKLYKELNKR